MAARLKFGLTGWQLKGPTIEMGSMRYGWYFVDGQQQRSRALVRGRFEIKKRKKKIIIN